jgi:hypothetical protein
MQKSVAGGSAENLLEPPTSLEPATSLPDIHSATTKTEPPKPPTRKYGTAGKPLPATPLLRIDPKIPTQFEKGAGLIADMAADITDTIGMLITYLGEIIRVADTEPTKAHMLVNAMTNACYMSQEVRAGLKTTDNPPETYLLSAERKATPVSTQVYVQRKLIEVLARALESAENSEAIQTALLPACMEAGNLIVNADTPRETHHITSDVATSIIASLQNLDPKTIQSAIEARFQNDIKEEKIMDGYKTFGKKARGAKKVEEDSDPRLANKISAVSRMIQNEKFEDAIELAEEQIESVIEGLIKLGTLTGEQLEQFLTAFLTATNQLDPEKSVHESLRTRIVECEQKITDPFILQKIRTKYSEYLTSQS